jgi:hypothetical protein
MWSGFAESHNLTPAAAIRWPSTALIGHSRAFPGQVSASHKK